jgi:hypothetical protein
MWFLVLLFSLHVFAQEHFLPCNNTASEGECIVVTDGYYALKREMIAGNSTDAFIKDINLSNLQINVMGEVRNVGSLVVRNYNVSICDICKEKTPSVMLGLKFILHKKLQKKYLSLIQNNSIATLDVFNQNGYILVFDIPKDDRYIVFFRDAKHQIRVAMGTLKSVAMQPNCRYGINLHFNNDFTVTIPKPINTTDGTSERNVEKNRIDMRIQNCEISYYHKYYAGEIYKNIAHILKN